MLGRARCCAAPAPTNRRDALIGAGLTLGAALVVAGIMLVARGPVGETVGLVMVPGVLGVGAQWVYSRGRSGPVRVALIVGTFAVLFLIGMLAGMVTLD